MKEAEYSMLNFGGRYRNLLRQDPAKFERVFNQVGCDLKERPDEIRHAGKHFLDLFTKRFA